MMGAAMFAQFKLQPMPSTDPMQAKVFVFMPMIMSVMMAWFPSGLVLYWLTNTLLSIAQQWRINGLVAAEQAKQRSGRSEVMTRADTIVAAATPPGRGGIGISAYRVRSLPTIARRNPR